MLSVLNPVQIGREYYIKDMSPGTKFNLDNGTTGWVVYRIDEEEQSCRIGFAGEAGGIATIGFNRKGTVTGFINL